jgi:hypothetical protein
MRSLRTEANDNAAGRPQDTAQITARLLPEDSDLTAVVKAWDRLPEAIKAGILAMVKAALR